MLQKLVRLCWLCSSRGSWSARNRELGGGSHAGTNVSSDEGPVGQAECGRSATTTWQCGDGASNWLHEVINRQASIMVA